MDLDRLEGTRQQALEARGMEVEEEEDVETLPMTPRREAAWCAVDAAPMVAKTDEACEEVLQIQARALARRMRHVHTNQVWIGLSGGLDSTLAMLVSLRTFALENWDIKGIHLVSMPAFGTGKRTRSNASALGESSGCDFREISLTEVLTQHFQDIGLPKGDHSVAFENAQARERTQILMDLANLHGGLHVGTGDFSESALGWSTYNGDHMSMFNVNGAIAKTMAQALVRYEAKRLPTLRPILEDQQLLIGGAPRDGLAIHAIENHIVHLELLGLKSLDGVENHIFGEFIVLQAIALQFLDFIFKIGCFLIIANHSNHATACCHAQLGKKGANELYVSVIHPIKNHRVNTVDDNVSFNHIVLLYCSANLLQLHRKTK